MDLNLAAPADAVRMIRVPVLVVHGTADTNIPLRHAQAIAAANPAVRLWIVLGASHTAAWSAAPDEFPRRLLEFIRHAPVPR